ncbi:MAG: hypothetical protein WC449_05240 [Candidatus Paceibacterota bacterium]
MRTKHRRLTQEEKRKRLGAKPLSLKRWEPETKKGDNTVALVKHMLEMPELKPNKEEKLLGNIMGFVLGYKMPKKGTCEAQPQKPCLLRKRDEIPLYKCTGKRVVVSAGGLVIK